MSTPAEVFNDIYRRRVWGEGSGGGSDPVRAAPYCRLVEMIIAEEKIRAVLDIGCGDGRVLAGINGHGAAYYGLDCAKEACWVNVMSTNSGTWASRIISQRDALTCDLPAADLVLLKEVTQHLPNADVIRLMDRLKDYPLVLHCSGYGGVVNSDIAMGETRPVDLSLPPFNLPAKTVLTYGGGYTVQLLEKA